MNIELNQDAMQQLRDNRDNTQWIENIISWIAQTDKYGIRIFQVIVKNELELSKWHNEISAAIAVDVQSKLITKIEKWNLYLIFECREPISISLRSEIEQDKYSTRKMVWDSLSQEEIDSKKYIENRLFDLKIKTEDLNFEEILETETLHDKIKRTNVDLYNALTRGKEDLDVEVALYMGGNDNGKKD
ncbi:ABC-three component system middle component 1 [Lacrimispora algidixylanolytica]|uniref:Uncharacterized protein n=1 Tax=Lacrimispora algidixylanolytica TaxID=94868 RepID=A0A419T8Z9_9FIRM|nr:ABC-three component system middle component 1 [Lacrimispora algidixylanolytica]RKD33947.1 hypothetical protein BET01_12325 [Lacrimispora algidixylanolytica]